MYPPRCTILLHPDSKENPYFLLAPVFQVYREGSCFPVKYIFVLLCSLWWLFQQGLAYLYRNSGRAGGYHSSPHHHPRCIIKCVTGCNLLKPALHTICLFVLNKTENKSWKKMPVGIQIAISCALYRQKAACRVIFDDRQASSSRPLSHQVSSLMAVLRPLCVIAS